MIKFEARKSTAFEKILLLIGLLILIFGFYYINRLYVEQGGMSWEVLQTVFVWLILFFAVIITSSTQDIKEELAIIIRDTKEEVKLLRRDIKSSTKSSSRKKK